MGKIILITMIMFSMIIMPSTVFAQKEAGQSAMIKDPLLYAPSLKLEPNSPSYEIQKMTLKNVFKKYNSPFTDEDIDEFMKQCTTRNMDCYLLPAIAGVESGFGKAILAGSYNAFGWGGGYIYFKDFKDCIATVAEGVHEHYIQKGATTIEDIGKIYSASPEWPEKVRKFVRIFEEEEKKNQLFFSQNAVK